MHRPEPFGVPFSAERTVHWRANIDPHLLDHTPDRAPDLFGPTDKSRRRVVVIDKNVQRLYGDRIQAALDRYEIERPDKPLVIPGGEAAKTRATVDLIHEHMEEFRVARSGEPVLLWGGGVVHDVGGFAAAEYRRGVQYLDFGSTVTAAIDAMFALKVGINDLYKNRKGAYHPPALSVADPGFFKTLSELQILDGVGEIFKVAVALDGPLFLLLEQHGARAVRRGFPADDAPAIEILGRCLFAMSHELSSNPYEDKTARASYAGHTISPGMEPRITHGAAVVLDLLVTLMIAWRREVISGTWCIRMIRLAQSLGLSCWHVLLEDPAPLLLALEDSEWHRGQQLVPVPDGEPGRVVYLNGITSDELSRAISDLYDAVSR